MHHTHISVENQHVIVIYDKSVQKDVIEEKFEKEKNFRFPLSHLRVSCCIFQAVSCKAPVVFVVFMLLKHGYSIL